MEGNDIKIILFIEKKKYGKCLCILFTLFLKDKRNIFVFRIIQD